MEFCLVVERAAGRCGRAAWSRSSRPLFRKPGMTGTARANRVVQFPVSDGSGEQIRDPKFSSVFQRCGPAGVTSGRSFHGRSLLFFSAASGEPMPWRWTVVALDHRRTDCLPGIGQASATVPEGGVRFRVPTIGSGELERYSERCRSDCPGRDDVAERIALELR